MYGLIGKITAVSGKRDELIDILVDGVSGMPGCLSYIVSRDPRDDDVIWVTEAWESRASHEASLTLDSVRRAIELGRPLITSMSDRHELHPVGGHGLVPVEPADGEESEPASEMGPPSNGADTDAAASTGTTGSSGRPA